MVRKLLLLVLLLPVLAQGQAVQLKRKPKVGDVLKYRLTFVFSVYGNDVFYTSIDTEKVTDVQKDGSYTVESTQEDIHASNGNNLPIEKNPKASVSVYDARGQILDLKGEQPGPAWRDAYLSCFILPVKPVAKGDKWTFDFTPRADRLTPAASVTYTLNGPEPDKVAGFNTLRIDVAYAEKSQVASASATGTIWVDPTNGTVVKLEEQWLNAPILGLSTLVNGHVSYERVP